MRLRLHAGLHIGVGCTDQPRESRGITITSGTKLHMAHKLARAFQNTLRVGNFSTSKESDIHVILKGIDVSKGRVSHACRRMTIVQALSYVVPALAHGLKPILRNFTQFTRVLLQPCVNGRISLGRIGKSKELAHIRTWAWPNKAACRNETVQARSWEPRRRAFNSSLITLTSAFIWLDTVHHDSSHAPRNHLMPNPKAPPKYNYIIYQA
jgi:hypothetical protein